jgi:O-antigen/teichoic acid export membrane protein
MLIYGFLLASIPAISEVWLGHYEKSFIIFTMLLTIGWAVNNLSGPAYVAYLGMGQLRWNMVGHVVIAVLNGILGTVLGIWFDGLGVVVGWVIALIVGSSVLVYAYHRECRIPLLTLLPLESRKLAVVVGIGVLASWGVYQLLHQTGFYVSSLIGSLLIYMMIVGYSFWCHPLRNNRVVYK